MGGAEVDVSRLSDGDRSVCEGDRVSDVSSARRIRAEPAPWPHGSALQLGRAGAMESERESVRPMGLRGGQPRVESNSRRTSLEALQLHAARDHPRAAETLHGVPPLRGRLDADSLARPSPHDSQLLARRRGTEGRSSPHQDIGADGGHLRRGGHEAHLLAIQQVQRRAEPNRTVYCVVVAPSLPPTNVLRDFQRRTG